MKTVCQGGRSVQQGRILLMGQIIQGLKINLRFSNTVVIVDLDKSSFGGDVEQKCHWRENKKKNSRLNINSNSEVLCCCERKQKYEVISGGKESKSFVVVIVIVICGCCL